MKLKFAMIIAALLTAFPAIAQTNSSEAQAKPPAPHQPGVAAKPADAPAGAQADPAAAAPAVPAAPSAEKVVPAKEAAIRHLMEVTETSKMGDIIAKDINSQVRSAMSRAITGDRLQKFMDDFSQKFSARAPSSNVADNTVAVYARHFSMEDIEGLTKFYESPVGQRVLKSLPEAQQEAFSSGQQLDQQAAMKVLRGLSEDYVELKKMLPPDPAKPEVKPASPPPSAAPSASAPAHGSPPDRPAKTMPVPHQ